MLMAMALMAACATGPTIVTNQDPDANFAAFETFDFMQPLSTDQDGVRSIISTHLITATTNEMQARELRRVETNPDLLVDFYFSTQERTQVRTTPTARTSPHSLRRYSTWPGYSMSMSTITVTQTTDGTVSVDVVDRARNQLVWEGAARGRVTDSTRRNMDTVVQEAIADVFAEFPR